VNAHLAQLNTGRALQAMNHPVMSGFAEALDEVNALADAAPGFVWRLQSGSGNATDILLWDDPLSLINMSVWESVEALREYAYRGRHAEFFKRRHEWFQPDASRTALWWIPAGCLPTTDEALARLRFIDTFGTSPFAFTIGQRHPQLVIAPAAMDEPVAQQLIGELNAELAVMYPEPGANHFTLTPEQTVHGAGGFFVARLDGQPVGCAGYRHLGDRRAEVKRMYTAPAARGLKLGAALLAQLEIAARADGVTTLVLETGTRQTAAIALYEKAGFAACPCWGEYLRTPDTSLCMGRALTPL
jgi:GNAT superfamily N-acetyltransferase